MWIGNFNFADSKYQKLKALNICENEVYIVNLKINTYIKIKKI